MDEFEPILRPQIFEEPEKFEKCLLNELILLRNFIRQNTIIAEEDEFGGQIQSYKLLLQELMITLRDRLAKVLLFNIKNKRGGGSDLQQNVFNITKLEYFFRTNEVAALAFHDGMVSAELIKRLISENIEEESIVAVLQGILEIIEQASINTVILI